MRENNDEMGLSSPVPYGCRKDSPWLPNIPPRIEDVQAYFLQKGADMSEADCFFLYYEKHQWTSKRGKPITDWKPFAWRWIRTLAEDTPWRFDRHIH
jgi:hypothetical protein